MNALFNKAAVSTNTTYRENTIPSFLKAASAGASMIEFDVQVTSDGIAVVFHDDYIIYKSSKDAICHKAIAEITSE